MIVFTIPLYDWVLCVHALFLSLSFGFPLCKKVGGGKPKFTYYKNVHSQFQAEHKENKTNRIFFIFSIKVELLLFFVFVLFCRVYGSVKNRKDNRATQ